MWPGWIHFHYHELTFKVEINTKQHHDAWSLPTHLNIYAAQWGSFPVLEESTPFDSVYNSKAINAQSQLQLSLTGH